MEAPLKFNISNETGLDDSMLAMAEKLAISGVRRAIAHHDGTVTMKLSGLEISFEYAPVTDQSVKE